MEWTQVGAVITPSKGLGRMVCGGGVFYVRPNLGDVHARRGGEWVKVHDAPGDPRLAGKVNACNWAMAATRERQLVVYSPRGLERLLPSGEWEVLGEPSPGPLDGAALVEHDGGFVLFGGRKASKLVNGTWVYRQGAWTQLKSKARPTARADAWAVPASGSRPLLLISGLEAKASTNDVWSFDGEAWALVRAATGRDLPRTVFTDGGQLYHFNADQLFRWTGADWELAARTPESYDRAGIGHEYGFDPERRELLCMRAYNVGESAPGVPITEERTYALPPTSLF
jgi:hypothetical protein